MNTNYSVEKNVKEMNIQFKEEQTQMANNGQ